MSRTRKLLVSVLCIVLALSATLLVVAACEQDETGYKLTLTYDSTQGNVTASAPAEGTLYDSGEQVTVTVTPNSGYKAASVTVNGEGKTLSDEGTLSFEITSDTTVAVTFDKLYDIVVTVKPTDGANVKLIPDKDKYELNDEVTVDVTPAEGNVICAVKVDGTAIEPVDGEYKFTVTNDVQVEVEIGDPSAVLKSLQGSIRFEGNMVNHNFLQDTETTSLLRTVFDSANGYTLMQIYNGDILGTHMLVKNVDGQSAMIFHDVDGTVIEELEDYDWSFFVNPFDSLQASDLVWDADNKVWTIEDDAICSTVVETVIGTYSDVDLFQITAQDNMATRLEIVLERLTLLEVEIDYQYSYDLAISEQGTATVPEEMYTAYEMTDGLTALKAAMERAAEYESYTLHYQATDSENNSYEYNVYYTPDGIYQDRDGDEKGWFDRADGNVWSFSYDPETQTVTPIQIAGYADVEYLKAYFVAADNSGEYYILFKDNGDNTFEVRPEDENNLYFCSFLGQQIATGDEQLEYFAEAVSFKVVLDGNGNLYQVILSYDYDGYVQAVLTFSDWGETQLPVDLSDAFEGEVDAEYCGAWASENGDIVLDITLNSVEYNGKQATEIVSNSDSLAFSVGEARYTLTPIQAKAGRATLSGGELSAGVEVALCSWVPFIGEFVGYNDSMQKIVVNITAFGLSMSVNNGGAIAGTITDAAYYPMSDSDGYGTYILFQFTFTVGSYEHILQQRYEGDFDQLVYVPSGQQVGYVVQRDKSTILDDWSDFYGTYSDGQYTVVLDEKGITVIFGGNATTVGPDEFVFIKEFDYDNGEYYYEFQFMYGQKFTLIQPNEQNKYIYIILDAQGSGESHMLINEEYELDWSDYVGNYGGTEEYTYDEYLIEITDECFYITVNDGAREQATINWFEVGDYGPQFVVTYRGESYYFMFYTSYGYGAFSNADESVYVFIDQLIDYTEYYSGTYASRDGKYKVVITQDGLAVTLDGGAEQTAEDLEFYISRSDDFVFAFTLDGKSFVLHQLGLQYDKLVLQDIAETIEVTLFAEGYQIDVTQFVGVYEVTDEELGYFKVEVTSDGTVTLTVGKDTYACTDVDVTLWRDNKSGTEFYELSFTANGDDFYFQVYGNNAYLYNEDESIDIALTRQAD